MAHTVCTYDGDFHCDQIFACYLIKKLLHVKPTIIRTRDSAIIGKCDYVIGVGSVYDHNKLRYDHHHLDLTLKSLDSSKPFKIKLSCAGLVYHHYGRSIIAKILNLTEPCFKNEVESLFDVIYENFVQEIDAMANRIAFCEGEPNFKIGTDLTSRINRLRLTNSLSDTENDLIQRFSQAIDIVGNEFEDTLKYYGNIWLPAKTFVKEALLNCKKVHSSGAIIDLSQSGGMPWIEHLINIERELNIEGQIKFAIFYDVSGIWRLSCVPVNYSLSELRIPFPPHWYGLNYHNLCDITGVPGCIYIHPLIGDFETKEACVAIATKMLQSNAEKHLNLNKSNSLSDGSFYSLTENLSIEEQLNEAYEKEQTDEDISRKFKRSSSMSAIEEELPEDWDPMKEDARSLTNTYAFDPSDIGAAIQGYKSGDLDKVCQRFLNGYCKFGENCVYKHLTHSQIDSLDTEEVLIDTFQSELVKVGMSLKVTVTECLSPYSLYVTPIEDIFLEQKFESRVGAHYDFIDPTLENYLNLTKELTDFYRRVENKENFLIYPAIGSLVAARSDSIFFRGRVIDMSYDEDELHIMNIDTGVELMVDRRDVLSLKPKFATLPAAAIHCAVDVPQGISITDQVMNNFSELVLRKRFKVQFVDKDMEGRYKINLFNRDGVPFVIDWNLL